jgi:hypothetical protein
LEDARIFLNDAKQFVSELNQAPLSISQIASTAAELEIALSGFNDGATLQAKVHLAELLVPLTGFQEFIKRMQEDRDQQNKYRLADASESSAKKLTCIDNYVKRDIANPKNAALNKLRVQLDTSVKMQNIGEIEKASSIVTDFLQTNEISCEIAAVVRNSPKLPQPTPRTEIALAGPNEDLVLLYNSAASAPSVAKDLTGKFVFLTGAASICFAQNAGMDEDRRWFIERTLRQDGAREVKVDVSSCDFAKIPMASDIVGFWRGELRKQRDDYVIYLTDLLQKDALRAYKVVSAADYDATVQGIRALSLQIASDVEINRRTGFGIMLITDAGSTSVRDSRGPRHRSRIIEAVAA